MNLQETITGYIAAISDDILHAVLQEFGAGRVVRELCAVVREPENFEALNAALWFARDATIPPMPDPEEFWQALSVGGFGAALEERLFTSDHQVRGSVVYIMGQLRLPGNPAALRRAFDFYLETDPLLLPRLLTEISWTHATDESTTHLLKIMVSNAQPLTRWAAMKRLGTVTRLPDAETELLKALTHDEYPPLQIEARYEWERLQELNALKGLPKGERRRRLKAVAKREPYVTFGRVEILFAHDRYARGARDYTPDELSAFVERLLTEQGA